MDIPVTTAGALTPITHVRPLIFTRSATHDSEPPLLVLWRIAVSGGRSEPIRLASLGENVGAPAVSRRGHRLAYGRIFFHSSIWRIAAPGSTSLRDAKSPRPVSGATSLISSTRDDGTPQYSADGKKIAFQSARSGNQEIWV